jgi:peptidoglycan/LPS O-acetylase OafA/YrhL
MFYLVLPILVVVFGIGRWTVARRITFFGYIAVVHVLIVLLWRHSLEQYQFQDRTLIRFLMFIAGILVFEALQRLSYQEGNFSRVLGIGAGAAVVCFSLLEIHGPVSKGAHSSLHEVIRTVILFAGYMGLSLLAMQRRGVVSRCFSMAPLRWLGNVSFSFYLIHGLVLNAIASVLTRVAWVSGHPRLVLFCLFIPALVTTFGVTSVLFVAVERPFSLTKNYRRIPAKTLATGSSRHGDLAPQLTVEAG